MAEHSTLCRMRERGHCTVLRLAVSGAALAALASSACKWAAPLAEPALVPQPGQTFQRRADDTGELILRGPYAGALAIEARWGGGPWVEVDPAPVGGRFDGRLEVSQPGRQRLEIREHGGAPLFEIDDVGLGDVFVLAGQSNMIMKGDTPRQSELGAWVLPVRVATGAASLFKPAHDSLWYPAPPVPHGSVWPWVADRILEATQIPVGYVAVAEGATALVAKPQWAPGSYLWTRMLGNLRVAAGCACAAAVLFHQGESDAVAGVAHAAYEAAIRDFAAQLEVALACEAPLVLGRIGAFPLEDPNATPEQIAQREANLEAIRSAQSDAIAASPAILAGPVTADLPVEHRGHFGDLAIPELAARWCESLEPLYGGAGALACR